jgi:hypothetical protein
LSGLFNRNDFLFCCDLSSMRCNCFNQVTGNLITSTNDPVGA